MDYSKLSTDDLLALQAGDLGKVSTKGLHALKADETNRKAKDFYARGATGGELMTGGLDPTEGNSFLQNTLIGAGKAVSDAGLGIRTAAADVADVVRPRHQNLTSLVTGQPAPSRGQELRTEYDQRRARDEPLLNTGGGVVGDIAGNVALTLAPGAAVRGAGMIQGARGATDSAATLRAAGNAMMVPKSIVGAGAQGATMGALQPLGTGDERGYNTAIGGIAGAAVPGLVAGARAARAAIDPLTEGGRSTIVGRALNEAAGPDAPAVRQRLAMARELVPGSAPTAGQVAESGGIAALERAAGAADPSAYAARAVEQAGARSASLRSVGGSDSDLANIKGVRELMSGILYEQAAATPINKQLAKAMKPQIENLMERPAMKAAVTKAQEIFGERAVTLSRSGSPEGLQLVKQALDDMIEKGGGLTSSIGKNQMRALQQTRSDLIATMEELTPKLREADKAFRDWSGPVNEMHIGRYLSDKISPALADHGALASETAARYAAALRDAPSTIKSATGRSGKTLEQIMQPHNMDKLNAIAADLARKSNAQNLGRGVGSDTFQKMSMGNLAERSGIPLGVLELPGIGRAAKWVYENTDTKMKEQLAKVLLDPQKTAEVMQKATPSERAKMMAMIMRSGATPLASSSPALINAQQQ